MKLIHVCSVASLINILRTAAYHPKYQSPIAGDSGLNCFIEGRRYIGQLIEGEGAELHLEWDGEIREVSRDHPFPLESNVLYNQDDWRAIIPAGTEKRLIKASGFEIDADNVSFSDRLTLLMLRRQLKEAPIHLDLYHKFI